MEESYAQEGSEERGPDAANVIEDDDDEYEGPCGIFAKEKAFRELIERKIYQESFGRFLELLVAITAIVTSIAYVVLTYIEPLPGPLQ